MGSKTNERSLARHMPLLSEFTRYGEWGAEAKRWANMLYNRPVRSGVNYFINSIKENESSIMDKSACGHPKTKSENGNRGK